MARSQETFNKKENESKKLKKRKEKELKKEERKSSAVKGGLESMMAYVDENGHIVTTQPDPSKKIEIKEEDIEIGVSRREDTGPDEPNTGKVSFFNDSKGYGFIKDSDSQDSYFVHINRCIDEIREGDKVTYELEKGQKGWNAVNVKLIPKAPKETPKAASAETQTETPTETQTETSTETPAE